MIQGQTSALPCRARPADPVLVGEDRSVAGVRDRTGPDPNAERSAVELGIGATGEGSAADNHGYSRSIAPAGQQRHGATHPGHDEARLAFTRQRSTVRSCARPPAKTPSGAPDREGTRFHIRYTRRRASAGWPVRLCGRVAGHSLPCHPKPARATPARPSPNLTWALGVPGFAPGLIMWPTVGTALRCAGGARALGEGDLEQAPERLTSPPPGGTQRVVDPAGLPGPAVVKSN